MGDNLPELTYELTPVQEQALLVEKAAPLIAFHFPAGIFVRDTAINAGYTFRSFLKHVVGIARYHENGQLAQVVQLGVKHGIFPTHVVCTLDQFVKLSAFLKSKEGQNAMLGISQEQKLLKRAAGVFEAKDVALEQLLQIQRQDYSQMLKEETSVYQVEINKLRIEIRKLEKRLEKRRNEIGEAFLPVSQQEEIDEKELGQQAWELYQMDATNKGSRTKNKTAGGLEYAVEKFGPQVKRTKDVEFAGEPENARLLFEYAKKKVLAFRNEVNDKQERTVRNLVVAAGGDEIDADALSPPEDFKLYRPRGLTPPPRQAAHLPPPIGVSGKGDPGKKRAGGGPVVQPRRQGTRAHSKRARSDEVHSEQSTSSVPEYDAEVDSGRKE